MSSSLDEELKVLESKVNTLKLDYERYFLGTRPREPVLLRGEVQKTITALSNQPIQNTALRFKFSSICSRFHAFKRQWTETLRKMEDGTYVRHRFKADLHGQTAPAASAPPAAGGRGSGSRDDLFGDYVSAREACGQSVKGLSKDKLDGIVAQQREALRKRYGDAEFRFKVVVEEGKAKLKAQRVKS